MARRPEEVYCRCAYWKGHCSKDKRYSVAERETRSRVLLGGLAVQVVVPARVVDRLRTRTARSLFTLT